MDAILLLIVFTVIIIFFIDFIPQFNTWQSRIKIGRFNNRDLWQQKVLTLSRKWLLNTPIIRLTDNHRLIIIDILKGNYQRSAIQSWQEAALILGLTEYYKKTGDAETQKQTERFVSKKMTAAGGWKEKPTDSDHAILAYAFLNVDFIDHVKYRSAFDETWQMILSLKGEDGTVAYKNHVRQYRFVDTIGFICPFLVNYGYKFGIPEAVELAVKQITEYQKYGLMTQENIPCHTYHVETKIPTGLFGWGRGLGWYVIGLIDTWYALPENHPHKKDLEKMVIATANSAIKLQQENGGFHWLLFDKGSRLDSSTAATLIWFFTLASEIPEIAEQCLVAREKALKYLMTVTRRSGAVDFSQGDTKGIGVYSQNFDILPFTQGFVLRTLYFQTPPANPRFVHSKDKPHPQP
ncbi:glycoside hydrolase family 88 protein [Kaistella sp. DKR-2]|uniref:glycoside hydrolase family 88 protein n=1 Tax=Kaistella soli TaxID=2849654 RepID=UPI001C27C1A3|nr:glycoside hydrolase family 88 protein [Kaistella soli]MBU8883066.1 glycoside hydrolase family 88 protein [Kaistella soli]